MALVAVSPLALSLPHRPPHRNPIPHPCRIMRPKPPPSFPDQNRRHRPSSRIPLHRPLPPCQNPQKRLPRNPTKTGHPPNSLNLSNPCSNAKLCSKLFPNPIPGSTQIRSRPTPAISKTLTRSAKNLPTSPTTSSYIGSSCIVCGVPAYASPPRRNPPLPQPPPPPLPENH